MSTDIFFWTCLVVELVQCMAAFLLLFFGEPTFEYDALTVWPVQMAREQCYIFLEFYWGSLEYLCTALSMSHLPRR